MRKHTQPKKHTSDRGMSSALIQALDHPLRRRVLRLFNKNTEWSPADLTMSLSAELGNLSYHMKVLSDLGVTRQTRTEKVRGTTKHFYVSVVADNKLVRAILAKTKDDDKSIYLSRLEQ